jgi:hypothetical protein
MSFSATSGPTAATAVVFVHPPVPAPQAAPGAPQPRPAEVGPGQTLSSTVMAELLKQLPQLYGSYTAT